MNIISLAAAAAVLFAGIAQAARLDPDVYYTTQSKVYATKNYVQWKNSRDSCYQVGMEPLALSGENIYAAFKALRESGHKHAWVERVRTKGGWDGSYLAVQLSTDAGHLNQRELHLGEFGELVEETQHATLHITLCERPGSHSRYGSGPRPDDRRSFELYRGGRYGPYRYDDRRRYNDGRYNERYDDNRYNGRRYVDREQYGPYRYDDRRRYNDGRYNERYDDYRYADGRRYYADDRYNERYDDNRYVDGRRYYDDRRYDDDYRYNGRRYYREGGALRRTGNRWIDQVSDSDNDNNRYRNRYNLSSDNYRSYDTKVPPRYPNDRRYADYYYDDGRYYYDRPYYGSRYGRRDRSRHVGKDGEGAKDSGDQRGGSADDGGYRKGGQRSLRTALGDPSKRKYVALPSE